MMRRTRLRTSLPVVLVLAMVWSTLLGVAHADEHEDDYEVLVFHRTTGFRHDSIPAAITAIEELGDEHGFSVTDTLDTDLFTDEGLAVYAAVVFFTDGEDILDPDERAAFERFVRDGGGFVGIHSTANMHTSGDWPWFEQLMGGAYFLDHPSGDGQFQTATFEVEEADHPATAHLDAQWEWEEEWYNFTANPRDGGVHVLGTVDESTYDPGDNAMGEDHPVAWCNDYDGGRSFYTALGHHSEYYDDEDFRLHLLGGIEWGAGVADGECGEPRTPVTGDEDFGKVTLDADTENPMELKVADDGRVFYVEIAGALKVYDPETDETTVAADIDVHRGNENGLMGLALDPDFDDNGWIYLFYSNPDEDHQVQNLSRFTYDHDEVALDVDTEVLLLEVPHQRSICCHSAGSMVFDSEGYLYVSTGDDTAHYASDGFSPHDDRLQEDEATPDAQQAHDARRTSGNTNDLRGSIIRIHPLDDPSGEPGIGNTYEVPDDNLFSPGMNDELFPDGEWDGDLVRQEIYAMGFRNPFHISIDPETDHLWVGDVGPDSSATTDEDGNERGPIGHDEWNLVTEPGNFGWPYCIADDQGYIPWDFGAEEPLGPAFDCENGPENHSDFNTGLTQLPPTVPATIYYPYAHPAPDFPELPAGGGRTAYGGPIYRYDPDVTAPGAFPADYDGRYFLVEWSRNYLGSVLIEDGAYVPDSFEQFMEGTQFRKPHAAEFGPDGNLYLLEWGLDFNYGAEAINPDSGLYRIGYGIEGDEPSTPPDDEQLPPCEEAVVDDFDGDSLDEERWTVVEPEPDLLTVADGRLSLQTVEGRDFHGDGGTLPNVVVQDLPGNGAWTAAVEMEWEPAQNFQNAGMVVWEDEDNLIKTGMVHADDRGFELIKELDGDPQFLGAEPVDGDFPSEFVLRYVYDGETLTSWARGNGDWIEIGSTDLDGLTDPRIGVYATNSTGSDATDPPVAHFESFRLALPGEPAEDPSDDFDTDELDGCRWDRVVRYDEELLEVADGSLRLTTAPNDILGGTNTAPNLVLQSAPSGDWVIETSMSAGLERSFQNAGLLYHQDDDNYLKMGVVALNDPDDPRDLAFELATEVGGSFDVVVNESVPDSSEDDYHLRLMKEGDTFTVQWSLDGEEWTSFGETEVDFDDAAFGLYAVGTEQQTAPVEVGFDYFHVVADDSPPTDLTVEATLDPADPDGLEGWYVSPVSLTLESNDDAATLQWRHAGDDAWTTWTEAVVIDADGEHDIEYRAVIPGDGNGEGEDEGEGDGEGGGDTAPSTVDVEVSGGGVSGYFDPDSFTLAEGGTATFTLTEGAHDVNVTDATGTVLAASPFMTSVGETFEFTAADAGQFYIFCEPHSSTSDPDPENWTGMVGSFQVVGESDGGDEISSEIGEIEVRLDQTPPQSSAELAGESPGGVYLGDVSITLDAADETSGVAETTYRVDGGEELAYDAPFTVSEVGDHTVEHRSVDVAGNLEEWQSVTFEISDEAPPPQSVCERHQGGASFPDAPGSGHRFSIDCLAELEIVGGFTDGTYGPSRSVTRAQLASFVVRALETATGETLPAGGTLFPDVSPTSTHGQAIYKLQDAGIIQGFSDGMFRPAADVTREQTARYVANALEWVLDDQLPTSGVRFPDVTADQYVADIDKLATAQIVGGFTDGTFGPRLAVTRGQMARFVANSLEHLAGEGAYDGP